MIINAKIIKYFFSVTKSLIIIILPISLSQSRVIHQKKNILIQPQVITIGKSPIIVDKILEKQSGNDHLSRGINLRESHQAG